MTRFYNTEEPKVEISSTGDKNSFASRSPAKRWHTLMQGILEDIDYAINNDLEKTDTEGINEGKRLYKFVDNLYTDIKEGNPVKPIKEEIYKSTSRNPESIKLYNDELYKFEIQNNNKPILWNDCPWLYTECLLYEIINEEINHSKVQFWKKFDIFRRKKETAFLSYSGGVEELAEKFVEIKNVFANSNPHDALDFQTSKRLFTELTFISLWGNANDLALIAADLSIEDLKKLQGQRSLEAAFAKIVDSDIDALWDFFEKRLKTNKNDRIDIVLDNSGFELYADLIYAAYLIQSGLASKIVLHPKNFPWFVSDVTPSDIERVVGFLSNPDTLLGKTKLGPVVGNQFKQWLQDGTISVHTHNFWTYGVPFARIWELAPDLASYLQQSTLIIFKGDLNYRKLTFDGLWPHTTPFENAIGALTKYKGTPKGLNILSLRTNKADVVVGLSSEEQVEKLDKETNGTWTSSGEYAVVSFYNGKSE